LKRLIVIIVLVATPVLADDIYLRGGGMITGQIIEQNDESVTVDIGGGTISANMSTVVRIEKSTSPLQEYRARAVKISADDTEAWRELARWAKGYALSTQAREAWRNVIAILPDDHEANTALGMVQLNGEWVSQEESYRVRGYIQFDGEWMTPAEQQSILVDRQAHQAQAEADRQANEARIKEINAEQKAQKAQEEADRQEAQNPISWGWGAGPNYWPHPRYPRAYYPVAPRAGGR